MTKKRKLFMGIHLENDPSVAIVENGQLVAFSEEERHTRIKHAPNAYPINALKFCLAKAQCEIGDISHLSVNWDLTSYNNGKMKSFYENLRKEFNVDENTINWQNKNLIKRSWKNFKASHYKEMVKAFGHFEFPKIIDFPHHYTHAFHSFIDSGFEEAIVLTIDGSGDSNCTTVWKCNKDNITNLKEINMPNSLGWFYAAFTEYLGYEAYDGEYKVMGLAAFGNRNKSLQKKLSKICIFDDDGVGYKIDPNFIHYGKHTYSNRFTDRLVDLFGEPPRREDQSIQEWHKDLAFEVQDILEKTIMRLVSWAMSETGISKVCLGGGVGLNVKLNSRIFLMDEVSDVFAHPLCSDSGAAAGAALLAFYNENKKHTPEKISTLALGYEETPEAIEKLLNITKVDYWKSSNLPDDVAQFLSEGLLVGWFQGRMEAGPRALGQRSILANPTRLDYRDKVNTVVKFREEWRPFCPSMLEEYADYYFKKSTYAPFMIIAFEANEKLKEDAPAIVHIDGTSRVQLVNKKVNPLYYDLIESFRKKTKVPVLLNTSFNLKGEPIVCSASDAIRTFWSSSLDVLVLDQFIISKPKLNLN